MPISCSSMPISCSSMPISCIASHKSNSITSSPLALAIRRAACVASHTAHADACLSIVQACLSVVQVCLSRSGGTIHVVMDGPGGLLLGGTAFGGDQLMRDRRNREVFTLPLSSVLPLRKRKIPGFRASMAYFHPIDIIITYWQAK